MNNDFITKIPKIDLHCHLDGSFSATFVKKTLSLDIDERSLNSMLEAPASSSSLTEYLTRFDLPIKCIQTYDNIKNGVLDVIKNASLENVKYMEIRFAGACSVNENLSLKDVLEAAITGTKEGKLLYDVDSNIILCMMRHHDFSTNLSVINAAKEYLGSGICAIDLAGDESIFPNSSFAELFAIAKKLDIPFTIHSGETGSFASVESAISFGAKRIGHGIAAALKPSLLDIIKSKRVGIELCPISNFQTGAVKNEADYPLITFLEKELLVTINTDNRTVSNTTLSKEYDFIGKKFAITQEDILTMYKNSIEISFADDNIKNHLLSFVSLF